MAEENLTRINKCLSEAGYCSRRAADKLIDQGRVTINGVVPEGQSLVQATTDATSMIRRFGSVKAFRKQSILQFSGIPIPTSMRIERGSDL